MRAVALLWVLVAVTVLTACDTAGERRREDFVHHFVQSAREDSDYFKKYVSSEDLELVAIARPMLTSDFEIIHQEEYSEDAYEYGVEFSNGATAVVAVYERAGEIFQATLAVNERPTQ